jgi:dephospho-CoA kinase
MPDRDKRRRADFVVNTGLSKAETLRQLRAIVTLLRAHPERYRRAGARAPKRPPAQPRPRRPRA